MTGFKLNSHGVIQNALEVEDEYWLNQMGLVPYVPGIWIGDAYPRQYTDLELAQQKITDLDLSVIAQGQTVTDLELTILGGT